MCVPVHTLKIELQMTQSIATIATVEVNQELMVCNEYWNRLENYFGYVYYEHSLFICLIFDLPAIIVESILSQWKEACAIQADG